MTPTLEELGLDRFNVSERLAIAEALWESVAHEMETAPLSREERAELERRLQDSLARPEAVTPWDTVKARILARAGK